METCLVLIDSEFRSLIRNTFERIINEQFSKESSKLQNISRQIACRAIASLIAIQLYNFLNRNKAIKKYYKKIKKYTSYIFIISFLILINLSFS